jgi:undecaprenyl-diphosphatase
MSILQIIVLAFIQGLTELLPVSSSAHVILAEKLMRLDPTLPEMTLLLVMLHTGTMLAVISYFWKDWKVHYFLSPSQGRPFLVQVVLATITTLFLGFCLKLIIEKIFLKGTPHAEVENLFGNLMLISIALACVGALIIFASTREKKANSQTKLSLQDSVVIGFVQGLCLPFRGFSRSGATISASLILGVSKLKSEEFSFALAVAITPFALGLEIFRLWKAQPFATLSLGQTWALFLPGLLGMLFSFIAGLLALKWISQWLEKGRWGWFGGYCLIASVVVWLCR